MAGGIRGSYISQRYLFQNERNSSTNVQTRILWFRCRMLTTWTPQISLNIHYHHHVVLYARISLTLSRHPPIATGRSSGLHPVSAQNCSMYVRAGRPAFARLCEGVHKSTSLMNSSLLLQHCPASLDCVMLIVSVIGGRWLNSCCFVGCCLPDLFNIARSIVV